MFANKLFANTFVRVRSATPARLVYVDRWVLVLLLLEGGVHRSICATVLGFFFGGVHGFTSLTACWNCASIFSNTLPSANSDFTLD